MDLKRKEKEARLAEAEEMKRRREEDERRRKMAIIQKVRAEEEERRVAEVERQQHKVAKLATYSSLADAIQSFAAQYDMDRVHACYRLLVRVLSAVVDREERKVDDEKVRVLRQSSEVVQRLLVRPVFGLWVLKWLGWEEVQRGGESVLVWPRERVDVARTKEVIETLNKELAGIVTPIPDFFASILSTLNTNTTTATPTPSPSLTSPTTTTATATATASSSAAPSVELVYYLAIELRNTFLNVVTSPDERNFRSIDLHSSTYDTLFAPFTPALLDVLDSFNYQKDKQTVYLVVEQPNVRRFEAAILELDRIIATLKLRTPIAVTVPAVLSANSGKGKRVKMLVEQLQSMMDKVLSDPFERKYHRVRLAPLWQRCGGEVVDGDSLLAVCGFDVREEGGAAGAVGVLSDPVNAELVRLRRREMERVWKEEVERRRREKEEAERAADRARDVGAAAGHEDGRRRKAVQRGADAMEEDEKGVSMDVD